MSVVEAPVFAPTWEEFKDFSAFMRRIEPICATVGLCKVIPPPEWKARNGPYTENVKIGAPIRQNCEGNKVKCVIRTVNITIKGCL